MAKGKQQPSVDKSAFRQAMASTNEACAKMEFNNNWVPPAGTYDVQFTAVALGEKKDEKGQHLWLRPTFEIISDDEFGGRTFSDFFYFTPAQPERDGKLDSGLRNLLYFATCLAGHEVRDAAEAFDLVEGSVGECLQIERVDNVSTKGKSAGKVFKNIQYLNRIESTEEAEVASS